MTTACLLTTLDPALSGASGWIGRWTPGIGDPTLLGWLTVAAYAAAAFVCYRLRGRFSAEADGLRRKERRYWGIMAGILLFLCINKQLDLQTAMTELLRGMAREEGWYAIRRWFQVAFIAILALGFPVAAVILFRVVRRFPRSARVAGLGLILIAIFVLIRAASFHHIDRLLGARVLHFKLNWILELGGIAVVIAGGRMRRRELNQGPYRP
jgi:hypothetical protein